MKKLSIAFVCIVLILSLSLMGCSGNKVAYTIVSLDSIEVSDNSFHSFGINFGTLLNSMEELKAFYSKSIFDGVDKQSELAKYDEDYFASKSLIAVTFECDKSSNYRIKSLSRRGDQLWLTVENVSMKTINEIARLFLEVSKTDVSGIKDINYNVITIK